MKNLFWANLPEIYEYTKKYRKASAQSNRLSPSGKNIFENFWTILWLFWLKIQERMFEAPVFNASTLAPAFA